TDRAWFDRPALEVAPELLGMELIHHTPAGTISGRLVEVEAYQGPEDLAAHSSHGRTARNGVMFGAPGHLYVYLIYGLHLCANVVCGPGAKPEAVLLRAAKITAGQALARQRRGDVPERRLAAGPGNLGAAFALERGLDGADLLAGPIRLAHGAPPARIERGPRIGVEYAGEWAARPMRFSITDDPHRSRR
ncbi:MAG TPA: DNA-3-methyladenine glycosylase, partial [Candidatus Limnocylindria bacterium]|nr:DNA-3-methyladenine glycosylase [Candidatus Limnocylindria bacterium]